MEMDEQYQQAGSGGLLPSSASWALRVTQAPSSHAAWQEFARCLAQMGFSYAGYEVDAALPNRANPQRCPSHTNLANSQESQSSQPSLPLRYCNVMPAQGLLKHWRFPVNDRVTKSSSALLVYCFTDLTAQEELVDTHRAYLQASSIYLHEGFALREIVEGLGPNLLSPREQDCLAWAGAGKSTKEISALLTIASSTVNEYLTHAQHKLRATNRAQAAARAMLLGSVQHAPMVPVDADYSRLKS